MSLAAPPSGSLVVVLLSCGTEVDAKVTASDDETVVLEVADHAAAGAVVRADEADLRWATDQGLFTAPVRAEPGADQLLLRLLEPPSRTQRREYIRVPVIGEAQLLAAGRWEQAHVADISEGGVRLLFTLVPPQLGEGTPSQVKVDLDGQLAMNETVSVVRVLRLREGVFEVALRFVGMDERSAKPLRQFLFAKQREMRARAQR